MEPTDTIGHNNLGNAHRGLGEYEQARHEYAQALATYRAYDDEWALAIIYEDVALLAAASGAAESAVRLIGAADALRQRSGSPRAPDLQAQVDQMMDSLRTQLGPAIGTLLDSGRQFTSSQADAELLAVCRSAPE